MSQEQQVLICDILTTLERQTNIHTRDSNKKGNISATVITKGLTKKNKIKIRISLPVGPVSKTLKLLIYINNLCTF